MFNLSFFINNITSLSQWRAPRRSILTRSVALLISLSFLLPTISWAFDIKTYENEGSAKTRLLGPHDKKLAAEYRVPSKFGKIVEAGFAPGDLTFILVQDLHCNYEIQTNIRGMLNHLMDKHPELKLVAVEGATGIIPTMELAALPDSAIKRAVADYFMQEGKLTGADCLAICDSRAIELFGAEDQELYDDSIELIQDFGTEELRGLILELLDQMELLENQSYNPKLLDFEQRRRAFMRGDLDVEAYHHQLIQEARGLKIALLPPALRGRGAGRLDYHDRETQDRYLEREIPGQRAKTAAEKRLLKNQEYVEIVERIVNVAASRKDIQAYQKKTSKLSLPGVLNLLQVLPEESRYTTEEEIEALEEAVGKALKFYDLAEQRNHALLENAAWRARDRGESRVILVTGGFHTPAIIELIRNQGCSYVSLRPRMEKAVTANNYFNLLRYPDQPTELERLMAQHVAGASAMAVLNYIGRLEFRAGFISAVNFMQDAVMKMQDHKRSSALEWGNLKLKKIKKGVIRLIPESANSMILRLMGRDSNILGGAAAETAVKASFFASNRMLVLSATAFVIGLSALGLSVATPVAAVVAVLGLAGLGVWWGTKHFKPLINLPKTDPGAATRSIFNICIVAGLFLLTFCSGAAAAETVHTLAETQSSNILSPLITAGIQQALSLLPGIQNLTVYAHDPGMIVGILSDFLTYLNTVVINPIGDIGLGLFAGMLLMVGQVTVASGKETLIDTEEDRSFKHIYGASSPDDLFVQELETKVKENTDELIGTVVNRWSDLPEGNYNDIIRQKDVARTRKLSKLMGWGNLEAVLAWIIAFKSRNLRTVILATVDILPEVINGFIRLAVSVVVIRPKKGLFQACKVAEDYDPHALRERFGRKWEEGMGAWDRSLSDMPPENAAMLEVYTSEELAPIVEKGMPAIAKMSAKQKEELGLNLVRYMGLEHDVMHALAHELIYLIPDEAQAFALEHNLIYQGEEISWITFFSRLFKRNPGVLIVKGQRKGVDGNDEELMPWQGFIETWCDKGALFRLIFSLQLPEGSLYAPEERQIVEQIVKLFEGELSTEEEQGFELFRNYVNKRGRELFTFPEAGNVSENPIYRAAREVINTKQTPDEPMRLNINFSFINSLFVAALGGTIVTWLVHSYLLGFFAAGAYLIFRICQIGYFEVLERTQQEQLKRNLEEWNTADSSYGNIWIKGNSWILSRCAEYSYDISNLELRPKEGSIIKQFFRRGFAPLYIEDMKINMHPIFLLLPRVMAETYLIHELRHFKDLKEHPSWSIWRFELSAKIASVRALQNIFKTNTMRSPELNPGATGLFSRKKSTQKTKTGIVPALKFKYDNRSADGVVTQEFPSATKTEKDPKSQKTASVAPPYHAAEDKKATVPAKESKSAAFGSGPKQKSNNVAGLISGLLETVDKRGAAAYTVDSGMSDEPITTSTSAPAAPTTPSTPAPPMAPPSAPKALEDATEEILSTSRAAEVEGEIRQRVQEDAPESQVNVCTNDRDLAGTLKESLGDLKNVKIETFAIDPNNGQPIGLPDDPPDMVVITQGPGNIIPVQCTKDQTGVLIGMTAVPEEIINALGFRKLTTASDELKKDGRIINEEALTGYTLFTPAQVQKHKKALNLLNKQVQVMVDITNTPLLNKLGLANWQLLQLQKFLAEKEELVQEAIKDGPVTLYFDPVARAMLEQVTEVLGENGQIVIYSDVGQGLVASAAGFETLATAAKGMGLRSGNFGEEIDGIQNELKAKMPGKSKLDKFARKKGLDELTTEQYWEFVEIVSSGRAPLVLSRGKERGSTKKAWERLFQTGGLYDLWFYIGRRKSAQGRMLSVGKRLPKPVPTTFQTSRGVVKLYSMVALALATGRLMLRTLSRRARNTDLEKKFKPQRLPIFHLVEFIKVSLETVRRIIWRIITGNVGDLVGKDPILQRQLEELQELMEHGTELEKLKKNPRDVPDSLKISLNLLLWIKDFLGKWPFWRKIDLDSLQPELLILVNEFMKIELVTWHFDKRSYMMRQTEREGLDEKLVKNLTRPQPDQDGLNAMNKEMEELLKIDEPNKVEKARISHFRDMSFAIKYQRILQQMDKNFSPRLLRKLISTLLGELSRRDVTHEYRAGVLDVLSWLEPSSQEPVWIRTKSGIRPITLPAELMQTPLLERILFMYDLFKKKDGKEEYEPVMPKTNWLVNTFYKA